MKKVLVPLAEGFEELEAITITDLLTRADISVVTAGLKEGPVKASRGATIVPDTSLEDVLNEEFDMIVLPGGQPGATNLEHDPRIHALLENMNRQEKYTAAICAAPKVLAEAGLLNGRRATSYPGTLSSENYPDIELDDAAVVVDGKVITSRGPGTAIDFALELIRHLAGKDARDKVESGLVRT